MYRYNPLYGLRNTCAVHTECSPDNGVEIELIAVRGLLCQATVKFFLSSWSMTSIADGVEQLE